MNLGSFPYETSWSTVNQIFLLGGPVFAISWTPLGSNQSHQTLDVSLIKTIFFSICLLAEPSSCSKKDKKRKKARNVLWLDQKAFDSASDQTITIQK